jgi:hypothetical protein
LQTAGYAAPAVVVPANTEKDWTVPAIIATIFCFFPTGLCAIIAAVNVNILFMVRMTASVG